MADKYTLPKPTSNCGTDLPDDTTCNSKLIADKWNKYANGKSRFILNAESVSKSFLTLFEK